MIELRDNKRLVEAAYKHANAAAMQLKQNSELATVDLITKTYDFANSLELQRSWLTVINTKISPCEDFEGLPEEKQLAFRQIASLFESVGLLVEKGYVKEGLVDDMFATQMAWRSLESFVTGMRKRFVSEDYYVWIKLHLRLTTQPAASHTGTETGVAA